STSNFNDSVLQLNDSITQINKQYVDTNQVVADVWFNLVKEFITQIENEEAKKEKIEFVISQAKLFYERSLQLDKVCKKEDEESKEKDTLVE
ncbi:hypothetical protein IH575_02115, partial [Candidatus Dojkabacteria bacterium]|nr:hypothetical protein [Candidatus Dojkabacteria bacterium]